MIAQISRKKQHAHMLINLKENENPEINPFDGIVLGTPIYAGKTEKQMKNLVKNMRKYSTQKEERFVANA
jgi:menaquinone-dependent protoporphyrinogen IX oxidase